MSKSESQGTTKCYLWDTVRKATKVKKCSIRILGGKGASRKFFGTSSKKII